MLSPRVVRVVTALIVVVFVAVTVLSMVPANAATTNGASNGALTVRSSVQQSAALTRARAKAAVARTEVKKAGRLRVRAIAAAVYPARAFEAAVGAQARAAAAVVETQTALERANAVLAGEPAARTDLTARYEAGKIQFDAAAEAYRNAGEQMAVLRTQQDALVEQLGVAYAQVEVAAGAAADVELKRIPAAAGAVASAWQAEQKARTGRVSARERFEEKRKTAGTCRVVKDKSGKTTSRWECRTSRGWKASKGVTSAAKRKEQVGRAYRKAKKARVGQEQYLDALKAELAVKRTELAGVQASAKDLDAQVAGGRIAVSAAEQETSRLRVAADEWDKTLDGIVVEAQKLTVEVDAARAQQPGLAAAIAPLTAEVVTAQAQVAATQGAHETAQAKVADAAKTVTNAKKRLARAVKRVKALSRR